MPAGAHRLLWDGRDDSGRPVDSGIYFVMLRAVSTLSNKELVATRKIILMK
jgi:flagellar hook assembly protein FlgD